MKNYNTFLNENTKGTEGIKALLELLGYDVMYSESQKEYFIEAMVENNVKPIWLKDN